MKENVTRKIQKKGKETMRKKIKREEKNKQKK